MPSKTSTSNAAPEITFVHFNPTNTFSNGNGVATLSKTFCYVLYFNYIIIITKTCPVPISTRQQELSNHNAGPWISHFHQLPIFVQFAWNRSRLKNVVSTRTTHFSKQFCHRFGVNFYFLSRFLQTRALIRTEAA